MVTSWRAAQVSAHVRQSACAEPSAQIRQIDTLGANRG